jgi:hypothetical protein
MPLEADQAQLLNTQSLTESKEMKCDVILSRFLKNYLDLWKMA